MKKSSSCILGNVPPIVRNGKYAEPNLPTKEYAELRILLNSKEIVSTGARDVLTHWKTEVKRGVGTKRAEQLYAAATVSIGLTEGLTAA